MTAEIFQSALFCLSLQSHFLDDIRETTKDDITIILSIYLLCAVKGMSSLDPLYLLELLLS